MKLIVISVLLLAVSALDFSDFSFISYAASQHLNSFNQMTDASNWVDEIVEVYDLLLNNEQHQRKWKLKHEKNGHLRSGEGSESEILTKMREREEQERLEFLLNNRKVSDDPLVNKKVYDLFLKRFKVTSVRNDKIDLKPHHVIEKIPPFLSLQAVSESSGRNLQASANAQTPTYQVNVLTETYPTLCYNNG